MLPIDYETKTITGAGGGAGGVGSQTFRTALDDSPCLWLCQDPIDDQQLLPTVCQRLAGTHDYSAFVHKAARNQKDNTLTVSRLEFVVLQEYELPSLYLQPQREEGDGEREQERQPTTSSCASASDTADNLQQQDQEEIEIVLGQFIVEGQRFRRTMVRNLVGYAVAVAQGKKAMLTDSFWTLPVTEAAQQIHSAPPTGLCLEFVKY